MPDRERERREGETSAYLESILTEHLDRIRKDKEAMLRSAIEILQDGDDDGRWMAVSILGEIGGERIIPILCDTTRKDSSDQVRAQAASVLGDYLDLETSFECLLEATKDDSGLVRDRAFETLGVNVAARRGEAEYFSKESGCEVLVRKPGDGSGIELFFSKKTKERKKALMHKDAVIFGDRNFLRKRTDKRGALSLTTEEMDSIGFKPDGAVIRFIFRKDITP